MHLLPRIYLYTYFQGPFYPFAFSGVSVFNLPHPCMILYSFLFCPCVTVQVIAWRWSSRGCLQLYLMTLRQWGHKKGCGRLWFSWACDNRNRTILLSLHNHFPTVGLVASMLSTCSADVVLTYLRVTRAVGTFARGCRVASGLLLVSNSTYICM